MLWAVIGPVAYLILFVVVFSHVTTFEVGNLPYPLYAFVGILCWSFFASTLGNGGQALLSNTALLAKTPHPTDAQIDESLTNICRCGTYDRIRAAIHQAAGQA